MWNFLKWTLSGVVVALIVATGVMVGYAIGDDNGGGTARVIDNNGDNGDNGNPSTSADFGILDEIEGILDEDFVNPDAVQGDLLEAGAIQGLIDSLGDAHTVYIPPEEYQNGFDIISGTFEGIGANVDQDPTTGEITIVAPFRGSPAEDAGILPGDVILSVDGASTDGWSTTDAVNAIRGPDGTDVVIEVRHSDRSTEEITVTRGTITIPTVFTHEVKDEAGEVVPDLAYLEISQFTNETVEDLRAELTRIRDEGYKGLILDLRRNPGGGLDATVSVADMFLDGGTVLTQVDRDGGQTVYSANGGGEFTDVPVVLLVSNGSASGSEVLAGALRDHGRAQLVGQQTFGKGSVNHIRELSNGGALYVTIARWLTPNGTLIEGVGLAPDVPIEQTPDELSAELQLGYGPQMSAAITLLQEQIAVAAR
jgi:carboxyl-terminal processing protease